MFWLQPAAARPWRRGGKDRRRGGKTGAAPAGEIVILCQDKDYEVAYLSNRSIAKPGDLEEWGSVRARPRGEVRWR
jgi:hypothetical protein